MRSRQPLSPGDRLLGAGEEFVVDLAEDGGEAGVEVGVVAMEGGLVHPGPLEQVLQLELRVAALGAEVEQRLAQAADLVCARVGHRSHRMYLTRGLRERRPAASRARLPRPPRRSRWTASDGLASGPRAP